MKNTNSPKKEFIKLLFQLQGKHNPFDVFRDFVEMSAIAIASPVNKDLHKRLENKFSIIRKRYTEAEYSVFQHMFAVLIEELETHPHDFLGEVFMELEFGNDYKGQFFTPDYIAVLIAKMTFGDTEILEQDALERGFVTVGDPCCGAGAMLIALTVFLKEQGIPYHDCVYMEAQDIDPLCFHMAYLQLSLLGVAGRVVLGDYLNDEKRLVLYTPVFLMAGWPFKKFFRHLTDARKPIPQPTRSTKPSTSPTPKQPKVQLDLFSQIKEICKKIVG